MARVGTARTHGPSEGVNASGSDGPTAVCRGGTRGIVSGMDEKLKDRQGGGCTDDGNKGKGWFGAHVAGINTTPPMALPARPHIDSHDDAGVGDDGSGSGVVGRELHGRELMLLLPFVVMLSCV